MENNLQSNNFSFQEIILKLQSFWSQKGCTILQPLDIEMGAGTFHPATTLYALRKKSWFTAYVQICRRPTDGRYGQNPNRFQSFHQFQVILKPSPTNVQQLMLDSFALIGIDTHKNDIRFVEDNWEGPTLGASGLGWEVWANGQEILQFTYLQQLGGITCDPVPVELTYGLERCACIAQGIDNCLELDWNGAIGEDNITYKDIFLEREQQFSDYNFNYANVTKLIQEFKFAKQEANYLLTVDNILPAYEQMLKASHIFNLIDARGALSVNERVSYISQIRTLTKNCCKKYLTKGI